MKATTKTQKHPLVKSVKNAPIKQTRNKPVTTAHVNRVRSAVKSSATPPKAGKFGKFIGQ